MKTKLPARSVIFNSGFLISLLASVFAVFLFAAANSSGLDSGAFSNASAQVNLASQARNAAQREKASFGQIQSSRNIRPRPLGQQCVTLRGPILTVSEA